MIDIVMEKSEKKKEPYGPWLVVTYGRNKNGHKGNGTRNIGGNYRSSSRPVGHYGAKKKVYALFDITNGAGRGGKSGRGATVCSEACKYGKRGRGKA
ncbi:hypothetical protein ACOSP7_009790 [Xanthoceras sorbifolium]